MVTHDSQSPFSMTQNHG